MIDICDLLEPRGLNTSSKVKLVRHQDKRYDIDELCRKGFLEIYQSYQSKPIFEDCEYIISFLGAGGTKAIFYGIYKVMSQKNAAEVPLPSDFPYPDFSSGSGYWYALEEVNGYDDFKSRVIIEWGNAALAWHQWLKRGTKPVIEILPEGYVKDFPGYLDLILQFDELVKITNNQDANREWHKMLSAVSGVYLITDLNSGKQYVGSAYGENGFLGRWAQYAQTGHGDNVLLKELLDSDKGYATNFQFSILHTMIKTSTRNEVLEYETIIKKKLGTRAFGLNGN